MPASLTRRIHQCWKPCSTNKSRTYGPYNMISKSTTVLKKELIIIPTNTLLMLYRDISGGKGLSRTVTGSTTALEVRNRPLQQSTTIGRRLRSSQRVTVSHGTRAVAPKRIARTSTRLLQRRLENQVEVDPPAVRAKTSPRSHVSTGKPDVANGEVIANSPMQASRSPARPLLPDQDPAVPAEAIRRTSGRRTRGASGTRAVADPGPMVLGNRRVPRVPVVQTVHPPELRLPQFVWLRPRLHRPLKDLPPGTVGRASLVQPR